MSWSERRAYRKQLAKVQEAEKADKSRVDRLAASVLNSGGARAARAAAKKLRAAGYSAADVEAEWTRIGVSGDVILAGLRVWGDSDADRV